MYRIPPRIAAASLKPHCRCSRQSAMRGIPPRIAAASLKHLSHNSTRADPSMYSAANRGGLIEAGYFRLGRRNGGGYSAANRGGLIEARASHSAGLPRLSSIPPRIAAASLKLVGEVLFLMHIWSIQPRIAAASLKPRGDGHQPSEGLRVFRRESRRPH